MTTYAPNWQPIETAPRDGTDILTCKTGYAPCVSAWRPDHGMFLSNEDLIDGSITHYYPDFWMPMPAPVAAAPDDHALELRAYETTLQEKDRQLQVLRNENAALLRHNALLLRVGADLRRQLIEAEDRHTRDAEGLHKVIAVFEFLHGDDDAPRS